MEIELKPCPFCGGTAIWLEVKHKTSKATAICNSCGAQAGPRLGGMADAVEAWNRRDPDTEKLQCELDALKEVLHGECRWCKYHATNARLTRD